MLNTFNITLNVDKSQTSAIPPLIHRCSDKTGLTIVAKILLGNQLAPVYNGSSNYLVCNFANGEVSKYPLSSVVSSVATVTLDNSITDNLGEASCYFSFPDQGSTTQNFKMIFLEDLQYADDDLTWGNSNFEGKIAGDTTSNPNIIGRSLVDYTSYTEIYAYTQTRVATLRNVSSDIFKNFFREIRQEVYDGLKTGFYDSSTGNNYLDNDAFIANPDDIMIAPGANGGPRRRLLYPVFARFKVPTGTRKVRINNILRTWDMKEFIDHEKGTVFLSKMIDNKGRFDVNSGILLYSDDINAEIVQLTNDSRYSYSGGKLYSKSSYQRLKDLDSVKIIDWSKESSILYPKSFEIDTLKNHIIDKDGYINVIQSLNAILALSTIPKSSGSMAVYPQMNIDYAYLDLS